MKYVEEIKISDEAIEFLIEVQRIGGKINRGKIEHDYLTSIESKYRSASNTCFTLGLMYKSDPGGDCYIEYAISNKGYKVLTQYTDL